LRQVSFSGTKRCEENALALYSLRRQSAAPLVVSATWVARQSSHCVLTGNDVSPAIAAEWAVSGTAWLTEVTCVIQEEYDSSHA
jgi:hypothetical protein